MCLPHAALRRCCRLCHRLLPLSPLLQELQCYQALSHTHIVGYIGNEFDTSNNCLYIFLEYVPGESSEKEGG